MLLLTNTGGLNREINPILSDAVWGAGWYTGAQHTNYADSQMQFSGALTFELQGGIPAVWGLITDWLVNWRVFPQNLLVSPNGLAIQSFQADPAAGVNPSPGANSRGGVWMNTAGFTIDPAASIKLNCNVIGLQRTETYSALNYKGINTGTGGRYGTSGRYPTLPLNPATVGGKQTLNQNPFPGWSAQTQVNLWPPNYPSPPGAPPTFDANHPSGMFMMSADWTFNNNTQVIRGCTGDANPAAVMQGVMAVEGTVRLFRDGVIPDPYAYQWPPTAPFTASTTNIMMVLGGGSLPPGGQIPPPNSSFPFPTIIFRHVLLTTEEFAIAGQNEPVPRTFGFSGLGDGTAPPMDMLKLG
jgi:hypothetical protein